MIKINSKKNILPFVFFIMSALTISAQVISPCGTPPVDLSDKNRQADERKLKDFLNDHKTERMDALLTIPVVVHVVWKEPSENISDADIYAQLATLNLDFKKLNADTANIPAPFKLLAGNPNMEFCLAQRTPDGLPTNGIIRRHTDSLFIMMGGKEKSDLWGGSTAWDVHRYLNIWVCNVQGYYGYAVFPSSNIMANFGITMNYLEFAGSKRTLDHEIGHLFNLRHIWGDAYCGDDSIADTPVQYYSNAGCPVFPYFNPGPGACTTLPLNGEMFMNHMDYTNDACRNMFTQQQVNRMRASLFTFCPELLSSDGCQSVALLVRDAGAHAVRNIPGRSCAGLINPSVTFRNWGSDTLSAVKIFYQLDGNAADSISWTGSLNSLDTASLVIPSLAVATGDHTFRVYTANPDLLPDVHTINDTAIFRFNIYLAGNPLPYSEGFEEAEFPPAQTEMPNPDGGYNWEKITATGCSGSFCMMKDNYTPGLNYPDMNVFEYLQKDEFILPNLNLSSAVAPTLTFRLAYAESNFWNPSIYATDTLEVLISTDCGNTFSLLYQKTDTALWTTTAAAPGLPYSPASASEWRTDTVDLSGYATYDNAIIKMVDKSFFFGNKLYIDDINIDVTTGITEAQPLLAKAYPNPSAGIFYLEFKNNAENYSIAITDILGRAVDFSKVNKSYNSMMIDLSGQKEGIYFVRIGNGKEEQYYKLLLSNTN